jgi:hypothetical protein
MGSDKGKEGIAADIKSAGSQTAKA